MADPTRWHDEHAKSAVAAAAAAVGVRRHDISSRIAEFASLLVPVGLVTTDGPIQIGWLRVLHDEIEEFARRTSVLRPPSDTHSHLAEIAASARRTTQLSGIVINAIDYAVLDIAGTIRRWQAELPVLRQAIERLSLLLDEWPSLMKLVNDAVRGSPEELPRQLRTLRAMLPAVPDAEARPVGSDTEATSVSDVLGARLATIWSTIRTSRSTMT